MAGFGPPLPRRARQAAYTGEVPVIQATDVAENTPPASQCREVAARLVARNRWRLVSAADLAARAMAELPRRRDLAGEHVLERLIVSLYVEALYHACSRAEGDARWALGYSELADYLHAVARAKYGAVAEDAAREAVLATLESFGACRNPRAFLMFALQRLWTCVRRLRRQEPPRATSLDQPAGDLDGPPLGERVEDPGSDPADQYGSRELVGEVARAAAAFHRDHPRARDQFAALYLKYIELLSDQEIGQALGTSPENVYVLRSRAKKRLRATADWRALADELGLAGEGAPAELPRRR